MVNYSNAINFIKAVICLLIVEGMFVVVEAMQTHHILDLVPLFTRRDKKAQKYKPRTYDKVPNSKNQLKISALIHSLIRGFPVWTTQNKTLDAISGNHILISWNFSYFLLHRISVYICAMAGSVSEDFRLYRPFHRLHFSWLV